MTAPAIRHGGATRPIHAVRARGPPACRRSQDNASRQRPHPRPPRRSRASRRPAAALAGVNINGTNFTGASEVVNNVAATQFSITSPTRITATVPSGASTGRIRVTTAGGTATSATDFTVVATPNAYRDAVLADNPAGYWRLGETTGAAVDTAPATPPRHLQRRHDARRSGALASDSNLAARFDGSGRLRERSGQRRARRRRRLQLRLGSSAGASERHPAAAPQGRGCSDARLRPQQQARPAPGRHWGATTASSTTAITDQAWHHVVATKSGARCVSTSTAWIDGGGHEHDADRERQRSTSVARQRKRLRLG